MCYITPQIYARPSGVGAVGGACASSARLGQLLRATHTHTRTRTVTPTIVTAAVPPCVIIIIIIIFNVPPANPAALLRTRTLPGTRVRIRYGTRGKIVFRTLVRENGPIRPSVGHAKNSQV